MASGGQTGMQVVFQMLKKIVKCLGFFVCLLGWLDVLLFFLFLSIRSKVPKMLGGPVTPRQII